MKKLIITLGLVFAGFALAAVPGESVISTLTGLIKSPQVVHNVILPSTTLNLGELEANKNYEVALAVENAGNVPETISAEIIDFSGVSILSIDEWTNPQVINPGQIAFFEIHYKTDQLTPGSPDVPAEIKVSFSVL